MIKVCTKCKAEYPATLDYFYKHPYSKCGLFAQCKKCMLKKRKEHHKQHRKEKSERDKRYRQTLGGYLRRIYSHIKQRCSNPTCEKYKNYGGRGIENKFKTVQDFLNYVINELEITNINQIKGLDMDRINNDGHYEPGNIRFVTHKENCNNR